MANEIVMTKEGYDDLVKELNELKTTRRAEISEKIRVARGFLRTANMMRRTTSRPLWRPAS